MTSTSSASTTVPVAADQGHLDRAQGDDGHQDLGQTDGQPDVGQTEGHPHRWLILAVLATVAFMAQLDLFIVNIAVPAMGRSFSGSGLSGLSWVLNAYSIVFAALLVPFGRLADHHGRRLFLLAGVAVFTLASIGCALAPSLDALIAARGLQAVGAAMIIPPSLGLLFPAFPASKHSLVVGIWAGVAAVAASSGPPIGGLLVAVDWRWIFIVNVPIGVAVLVAGPFVLPEIRAPRTARLPGPLSTLALFLGVSLAVFAMTEGSDLGWTSPLIVAAAVIAVTAIVITVVQARVNPRALIEASLFRNREFAAAAVALFLFFIAFAAWLLLTVLFLQDEWHYDALRAGLAIAPGPLTAAVFAVNSGRIAARVGRKVPAVLGPLFTTSSALYWIFSAPSTPSYLLLLPGMLLGGAGAGLTQAPLFAAVSGLPPDRATTGSAVLNMSRQIGSALGIAMLVALLATANPHALAEFRRGWWLEVLAALAAAAVVLVATPSRRSRAA